MGGQDDYGLTSSRFLKDWAYVILASIAAVVAGSFFPFTFLAICMLMIFIVGTAFLTMMVHEVLDTFRRN
jgi:hypothetical protein